MAEEKKYVFPKKLGDMIDRLHTLREERLELTKVVDDYKAEESALEAHILRTFPAENLEGAAGKLASASVSSLLQPSVKDWPKLYSYITKTNSYDLLQKRPAVLAFRLRWEQGVLVPGVEKFNDVGLTISKR